MRHCIRTDCISKAVFIQVFTSILIALFTGCTTRIMSIKEGDFDVTSPPTIKGAEFNMKENSSFTRVSADIRNYNSKSSNLSKVWTGAAIVCDGDAHCADNDSPSEKIEPGKANISYVFKSLPVSLSIENFQKYKNRILSYGIGLDPMPYVTLSVGINGKWGEFGVTTYLGIDASDTRYTYEGITASEPFIQSWPEPEHFTTTYSGYQIHLRGGFGGFASLFAGPIALTYAPTVQSPWLWTRELNGENSGYNTTFTTEYEMTFDLPIYFSHYFGITYNFHKKVLYSTGLTVINGIQLKERLYLGSVSVAYLF